MKILFAAETLYPVWGGSDVSARVLMTELSKEHEVHAVYMGDTFDVPFKIYPQEKRFLKGQWRRGVKLYSWWKSVVGAKIDEIKPDVLITQGLFMPASIEVAKEKGVKVVSFVRNTMHVSINGFIPVTLKYYSQYPYYWSLKKKFRKNLVKSDVVIANSSAIKKITDDALGTDCVVVYPFVKMKNYKVKSSKEYITMINPDVHKGYRIFREIAIRCPTKKFLVVGKDIVEEIPNIKVVPWVEDMKEVYSKTRMILLPSFWFEPCGRIQLEGLASLIPSVVSNKGGLPETVPLELVVKNLEDIDEWVAKIELVEGKDYSKELKRLSLKFDFSKQMEVLNGLF